MQKKGRKKKNSEENSILFTVNLLPWGFIELGKWEELGRKGWKEREKYL